MINRKPVHWGKSLVISVFIIILSSFVGIVFKAQFASKNIQTWLQPALAKLQPKWSISVNQFKLSLSDGIWPRVALVAKDVKATHVLPDCGARIGLHIDSMTVPIPLWHIYSKDFKVRVVEVGNLSLFIPKQTPFCPDQEAEDNSLQYTQSFSGGKKPKALRLPQISKSKVERIEIEQAEIILVGQDDIRLQLNQFRAQLQGPDFKLKSQLLLKYGEQFTQALPRLKLSLSKSGNTGILRAAGRWREGGLDLQINASQLTSNPRLTIQGRAKHLPLMEIVRVVSTINHEKQRFFPVSTWASFHTHFTLLWSELMETDILLEDIAIRGGLGTVKITAVPLSLKDMLPKPFKCQIENMNINSLAEAFGSEGPAGVFQHFGNLSGTLAYDSPKNMKLTGKIKNAIARFSGRGRTRFQQINSATIEITQQQDKVKAEISEADMNDGKFAGLVSVELDSADKSTIWNWDIKKLQFSQRIDALYFDERTEGFGVSGSALTQKGQINRFKTKITLPKIVLPQISLASTDAIVERLKDKWQMHVYSRDVALKKDSILSQFIEASKAAPAIKDSNVIELNNISANFSYDGGVVEWNPINLEVRNAPLTTTLKGKLDAFGNIKSELFIRDQGQTDQYWQVQGPIDKVVFIPRNQSAKTITETRRTAFMALQEPQESAVPTDKEKSAGSLNEWLKKLLIIRDQLQ
jgi:hypothetical protein